MPILVKRAYDKPSKDDGVRALVERTWPRGLGKDSAKLDLWLPELGPSADISKLFRSNHSRTNNIQRLYFAELNTPEAMNALHQLHTFAAHRKPLTLLYSGTDPALNPAAMLKHMLEGGRKPPTGSGPGRAAGATGQLRAMRKSK